MRNKNAGPRGLCSVCGFNARLRLDGMIYRHWDGFGPSNPDGTCQGWGRPPLSQGGSAQEREVRRVLVDVSVAQWMKRAGV